MKHVILTPNPYRDKNFQTVRQAVKILKDAGIDTKVCLPFEVDRNFDLPSDIRFHRLDREIQNTELVISASHIGIRESRRMQASMALHCRGQRS